MPFVKIPLFIKCMQSGNRKSYFNIIQLPAKKFLTQVLFVRRTAAPINYCASDIRICTPARVSTVGAEEEIYGFTRLWSKYSFTFTRLFT